MKAKFYNIMWDTDGEPVDLPTKVVLDIPKGTDLALDGADILSDLYGFCVEAFSYTMLEN